MILSSHFFDLLDCLAGQFFSNKPARCSGEKFGINISSNAKEYFSIAIIQEELSNNLDVLGVLINKFPHAEAQRTQRRTESKFDL